MDQKQPIHKMLSNLPNQLLELYALGGQKSIDRDHSKQQYEHDTMVDP
jgi:hypothetical protein